jgi:hypothetical protein
MLTKQNIVLGNTLPLGTNVAKSSGYVSCEGVVVDPRGLPGSGGSGADCSIIAVAHCCVRHGSGLGTFQPPQPLGCPTPVPTANDTCPCHTTKGPLTPYNTICPLGNGTFPNFTCNSN